MKSTLKEMLQDLIKGQEEAVAEKLHHYITQKTRQVTGLAEEELSEEEVEEILTSATDEELEEAVRAHWRTDDTVVQDSNGTIRSGASRPKTQADRIKLANAVKDARRNARSSGDSSSRRGAESGNSDFSNPFRKNTVTTRQVEGLVEESDSGVKSKVEAALDKDWEYLKKRFKEQYEARVGQPVKYNDSKRSLSFIVPAGKNTLQYDFSIEAVPFEKNEKNYTKNPNKGMWLAKNNHRRGSMREYVSDVSGAIEFVMFSFPGRASSFIMAAHSR